MEDFDISVIGRRSVHGVLALVSRQFILNIISFAAALIVFTELSQREVGIYTAVIAIQRIISFFTDFGFGAALVQKKEKITDDDISTTFTLQIGITLTVLLLTVLAQPYIIQFFKLGASSGMLLIVLVFSIFLSSFKVIPSILLERKIEFQKLVIPQIIEQFTFYGLLVFLILRGYKLQSYTWAFLVSGLASIPFYYSVSPWKIRFGIKAESLAHLKYGLQFQAKNILATVKDDLLTVFLAKFILNDLGYIGFGQKWAFFVYRYVVDSVTKVTFSTYARMQDDKKNLGRAIEKSLFFVSAVMFPTLVGLILAAPSIVRYFPKWHGKWEMGLFSLTFFALNAIISSLSGILVNVLDANGRVKTTLKLMIIWTVMTWILTPLLLYFYGYNGVSVASFLVTLTIFYTVYLVKKVVDFHFLQSIYKPAIATCIMAAILYYLIQIFVASFISLFAVAAVAAIIYSIVIYAIGGEELKQDIHFILHR